MGPHAKDGFEEVRRALSDYGNVLLVYIFGSAARGCTTPLSDIDVAVLLRDNSLKELGRLWSLIAKALRVSEDRVDLVNISKAPPTLKYNVIKG